MYFNDVYLMLIVLILPLNFRDDDQLVTFIPLQAFRGGVPVF